MNLKLDNNTTKKITRPDYVRGLLRMHKIRSRDIARRIDVHESAICHVLSGRIKNIRIQQAIADFLEMPFEELWGKYS